MMRGGSWRPGSEVMSVRVWCVVLILSVWMILFSPGVVREGVTDALDDDAIWGSVDCGSEELVELCLLYTSPSPRDS